MANSLVVLTLTGVRYSGQSVGDDLTIEAEIAGKLVNVNKKLASGQSAVLNVEIGQFITNQSTFSVSGVIRVVERDPVFNDTGETEVTLKVNLSSAAAQRSVYRVKVVESAGTLSGATAFFDVSLQAVVMPTLRLVADEGNGWLRVSLAGNSRVSLPASLKVEITRVDSKREFFTILEGAYRGRSGSIRLKDDGSSHLVTANRQTGAAKLVYFISKKTLRIKGKSWQTRDYPSTPWATGIYDIEIPDAPHRGGLNYPDVVHAITWFRVGHTGDRYIHTGRNSLGCITVTEHDRWDELYTILVRARKDDGRSIGTLQVVE